MRPGWVKAAGGIRVRLADMSLPPEQRRRKQRSTRKTSRAVPAQLDHGNGSKAGKLRATYDAKRRKQRKREGPDA